ncbi:MAG: endonuclease/exonuclease/phosphatase family protein, partial [Hyphomicrobiales bacterium]
AHRSIPSTPRATAPGTPPVTPEGRPTRWAAARNTVAALALLFVAMTFAAFMGNRWWVFDLFTSFRSQLVCILTVLAIALAAFRRWRILVITVFALMLNVGQVAPLFVATAPDPITGSPTLSIAHLNLQSRKGSTSAIVDWLAAKPADVVVIFDTPRSLADAVSGGLYGYRMIYPRVTKSGTDKNGQTTVAYEPRSAEVVVVTNRDDVTADKPTDADLPGSVVQLHASIGQQTVSLLGLHTRSPTSPNRYIQRNRQLDALTAWMRSASEPAIAFGDFNVTYFSPTLRRVLDQSGSHSSQIGFGLQPSWPSIAEKAGIAIDQSIYKGSITPIDRRLGPSFGSQHHSLIVTYAEARS